MTRETERIWASAELIEARSEIAKLRQALRAAKVLIEVSGMPRVFGPEATAAWWIRMAEIDAALGEGAAQPHRKKDR